MFTQTMAAGLISIMSPTAPTVNAPYAIQSLESELEPHLRDLAVNGGMAGPWVCAYVLNSVRNATVLYSGTEGMVVSARYDYRCGDSTDSDTIYLTFRNGSRTCDAYRSLSTYCTLYGRQNGTM